MTIINNQLHCIFKQCFQQFQENSVVPMQHSAATASKITSNSHNHNMHIALT